LFPRLSTQQVPAKVEAGACSGCLTLTPDIPGIALMFGIFYNSSQLRATCEARGII
jgi:hypothetical protein